MASPGAIIPPLYGQLVDYGKETLMEAGVSSSDALAILLKRVITFSSLVILSFLFLQFLRNVYKTN